MKSKHEDIIKGFFIKKLDGDEEAISFALKQMGITYQQLSDEIDIGIQNGYSVDDQLAILEKVL